MENENFLISLFSLPFLLSVLRGATPLLFASLGGLLSERSGVVQIALEGFMLIGALIGAVSTYYTGSPWLGFVCGGLGAMLFAIFFNFFVLSLKSDQIVAGTAINLLAAGVAPFITKIAFNSTGSTPSLAVDQRFSFEPILIALVLFGFVYYVFHKTKAGLLLQFAGEEPIAVKSSGFSVLKIRWIAVSFTGLLAGWGGASLSLFLASSYSPHMTGGRGFMALAALIFGKWRPGPTLAACLFFAFIDAVQIRLQGVAVGIPVQWIQMTPYLVTIVALAGFFGRSRAPKNLGNSTDT